MIHTHKDFSTNLLMAFYYHNLIFWQIKGDYSEAQNDAPTLEASMESEAVGKLVNYHIYGGKNVIATGEQVNQQVSIVHQGDAASLLDYLRELGVEEVDLQELGNAVASEPEAVDGNYGPQVGAWLGGMLTKAATGVWSAGVEAAPQILIEEVLEPTKMQHALPSRGCASPWRKPFSIAYGR